MNIQSNTTEVQYSQNAVYHAPGTFYALSDIHGEFDVLVNLLQDAELIDENLSWNAGNTTLCFLGDYVDRGPDGIGVIDLVMRLEREAPKHGGKVISLIGNHDVYLLAAYHFKFGFQYDWLAIGGQFRDLQRLTPEHVQWLADRPAMYRVDDLLLIHADALMYAEYGQTIDQVNKNIRQILARQDNYGAWIRLIEHFYERYAFFRTGHNSEYQLGVRHARAMLDQFGGSQIVHGHTPIPVVRDRKASTVTKPFLYAHGLCVNVDGGVHQGSPGVLYHVDHTSHT